MSDEILAYDWTQHVCAEGHGGYNPALIPEWKAMTTAMLADPEGFEATTDGGWPRVGWRRVRAVEMRETWPYNRPVPSVLVDGPFGSVWKPIMMLSEIRYLRPGGGEEG